MSKTNLLFIIVISMLFAWTVFPQSAPMTNDDLYVLIKSGMKEAVIIDKIRTSETNFDLSIDSLIKLKGEKVSSKIITAMLESNDARLAAKNSSGKGKPRTHTRRDPSEYGLFYVWQQKGKEKRMKMVPNISASTRTGGHFTKWATRGIAKIKTKLRLPGAHARMQIQFPNPVFQFYLDEKSGGLNSATGIPYSPEEFVLVKFLNKPHRRQLTIARRNAFFSRKGISEKHKIPFVYKSLGDGIYEVKPTKPLVNGEYAFFLLNSSASNAGIGMGTKFFDFGVDSIR